MDNLTVSRLEGEPIIVAKAWGQGTVDTIVEVFRRTEELRKDMPKTIYRITDVTELQTSFTDIMQMMREAAKRSGSSSTDPTIILVFVGTGPWVKLFTDALRQGAFGGKEIPVFDNFDKALAYVRADIAEKAIKA